MSYKLIDRLVKPLYKLLVSHPSRIVALCAHMKHPVAVSVAAFIMVLLVILWLSVALVLGAAEPRSSLVLPTVVSVVALALSAVATMLMPMDVMILGMAVKDRPAALVVFVDVAYVAVAVGAALLWLSIPGLYVAQAMAEEEVVLVK